MALITFRAGSSLALALALADMLAKGLVQVLGVLYGF